MSKEQAGLFVAKMRDDRGFRKTVGLILLRENRSGRSLQSFLNENGYHFSKADLVHAMAACMDEIETMMENAIPLPPRGAGAGS